MAFSRSVALFLVAQACITFAEVDISVPESAVLADEVCLGDEADCSVSLRQLRGELRVAAAEEQGSEKASELVAEQSSEQTADNSEIASAHEEAETKTQQEGKENKEAWVSGGGYHAGGYHASAGGYHAGGYKAGGYHASAGGYHAGGYKAGGYHA